MSKELIERVTLNVIENWQQSGAPVGTVLDCEAIARASILAVLDHFSEPGNVTENMALELFMMFPDTVFGSDCNKAIANAMRAARDELRGGT